MMARGNKVNKEWHSSHRMPANPTRQQRLEWHFDHTEKCDCRPVPESLEAEVGRLTAARDSSRAN